MTFYKRNLSEEEIVIIFKQVCEGVKYIHDKGYVHRDIASDNIVIKRDLSIKIIDFGFANQIIGGRNTYIGTL